MMNVNQEVARLFRELSADLLAKFEAIDKQPGSFGEGTFDDGYMAGVRDTCAAIERGAERVVLKGGT